MSFIQEKGISVVICFYNSSERITPTMKSIFSQEGLEDISWELILVDNASTDTSVALAQQLIVEAAFPNATIVSEAKPGLNYARKKGIDTAQYDTVLFCDDDNWLNPTFVARSYHFLKENDAYGVVGGNGVEACEVDPPDWFEKFKSIYAIGCRRDGDVTNVYGAGMCFRKSIFDDFEPKMTDRKGKSLSSGGDSEMCNYAVAKGYKIRQLCDNTFQHFIPKDRLTKSYLYRMARGMGQTKAQLILIKKNNSKMATGIFYRMRLDTKKLFTHVFKLDNVRFVFELNRVYSYWITLIRA